MLRLSLERRRAYVLLAFVVYVIAFFPLFYLIGPTIGVIGLVPVVVTGLLLGPRAGACAAILCLACSTGWYMVFGYEAVTTLPRTVPAHLVYAFVGAIVGLLRDMGSALRDERARVERSQRLLVAAERTAKMGSWEVNLATGQSTWSEGTYRLFGLPLDDATGSLETVRRLVHPADRDRFDATVPVAYAKRQPYDLEFRVVRVDGEVRTLNSRASIVHSDDGMPRMVGIAQDVTEQRELEARLHIADRLASLGTLAGGVAHEINNPLAYVAANLEFVSGELTRAQARVQPLDSDGALTALAEARDGARRIASIVSDLRTFARGGEERLEPLDVHRVLDAALALSRNELRHRAAVVKEYGDLPAVIADDARLGQVFVNLLINAAQSIPDGKAADKRITVRTRSTGGRVEIDIADTGTGVAPAVRARIFDPFFTTKPQGIGMGLGLSICHGIVRQLGGELTLVSTEVGEGTTMRVSLPAAPVGAEVTPHPAALPPALTRRARVLIIDDEELLLQAIRRVLGARHDVDLARTGAQALELCETHSYDVIFCDLLMPEMSGMDVHAALHTRSPALARRMVFMTGGAFTARAKKFLDDTSNLRIDKPVRADRLLQIIAERVTLS